MATISPVVLGSYATVYNNAFVRIQTAAEQAAQAAWISQSSLSDEDEWYNVFWAIVYGASLNIAHLVTAYLQAQINYLGVASRFDTPDITGLVTDQFDNWAMSPMVRARWLVSEGIDPTAAITEAALRTSKLTNTVTRVVEQATKDQLLADIETRPVWLYDQDRPPISLPAPATVEQASVMVNQLQGDGYRLSKKGKGPLQWRRVPRAGACGWCLIQSGRLLTSETRQKDSGWHTYCRCQWRMVTAQESRAWENPYADGKWRDVIDRRFEPGEVVNA